MSSYTVFVHLQMGMHAHSFIPCHIQCQGSPAKRAAAFHYEDASTFKKKIKRKSTNWARLVDIICNGNAMRMEWEKPFEFGCCCSVSAFSCQLEVEWTHFHPFVIRLHLFIYFASIDLRCCCMCVQMRARASNEHTHTHSTAYIKMWSISHVT